MVLSDDRISVKVKDNESDACDQISSTVNNELDVHNEQYDDHTDDTEAETLHENGVDEELYADDEDEDDDDDETEVGLKAGARTDFLSELSYVNNSSAINVEKSDIKTESNRDCEGAAVSADDSEEDVAENGSNEPLIKNDDKQLRSLLKNFDLEILYTTLKLSSITFRSLPYLEREDIKSAIHHIGYRAEFREKLFAWRGQQDIKAETQNKLKMISKKIVDKPQKPSIKSEQEVSSTQEIKPEMKNMSTTTEYRGVHEEVGLHTMDPYTAPEEPQRPHMPLPAPPKGYGYLPKGLLNMKCRKINLQNMLRQCHSGRSLMLIYDKNGKLESTKRAELVRLIIGDLVQRGERLTHKDYNALVHDIVTVFPNEKATADYYYIDRNKYNPVGRLYQCYCTENAKRRKMLKQACKSTILQQKGTQKDEDNEKIFPSKEDESDSSNSQDAQKKQENAAALKELIQSGQYEWDMVSSKWLQTLSMRQTELKESGFDVFFKNWPIYRDARSMELFTIDFKRSYPGKENLLFAKWSEFSEQMMPIFEKRVTANFIRKWIRHGRRHEATKDEKDFALAIGLIGLLPTVKNFKDKDGKLKTRSTVKDNMDSFIMTLTALENFEKQHEAYVQKFGDANRTQHPFLVIISTTDCNISKVYVVVGPHHYCMKSFLHALDLCYKVYHTCGLRYPTMCENVWTFIQRYFYNMSVPWESRNPNLSSFINALTSMG